MPPDFVVGVEEVLPVEAFVLNPAASKAKARMSGWILAA